MESDQNKFQQAFKKKFIGIKEQMKRAEQNRIALSMRDPCIFPLTCLNDFLFGIMPSELLVIGADTGIGKTWLANEFARVNALIGKKVYLFSLEGEENEVSEKFRFHILSREFFKNPTGSAFTFRNYMQGRIDLDPKIEEIADRELELLEGKLETYDKSTGLTLETLTQQMENIRDADLVIIDHLHYFYFRDDQPEAVQITAIMRRIKELTEIHHIPVVLVSHLRKKTADRGIPSNEEFMGSSNIAKIATSTITISSYEQASTGDLYPTIIRVAKDRYGMRSDIGFVSMFNVNTHNYNAEYNLVKIDSFGKTKALDLTSLPFWMKEAFNRTTRKQSNGNYRKPDVTTQILGERFQEDTLHNAVIQHEEQQDRDSVDSVKPEDIVWEE